MTYYLYHVPNFGKNGKDYSKYVLVSKHDLVISAKMAAIRFIKTGRKVCVISKTKPTKASDILWIVQYSDGKRWWKDPEKIKRWTGWVFNGIHADSSTLTDSRLRVKEDLKNLKP